MAAVTPGDFEEDLNSWFPSSTAADYAIFESGLVDADTYVEQGLKWKDAHYAYLTTSSARVLSHCEWRNRHRHGISARPADAGQPRNR